MNSTISMDIRGMKIQPGMTDSGPAPALRSSGLNFEKLLASLVDVICVGDEAGVFCYVSPSAERLFGYTAEEMIGRSCLEFIHPADIAHTLELINNKKHADEVANFENRYRRKDGTLVPVVWSWRWDREECRMYSVGRDASEKYKAEQRLLKAQEMARVANYEFDAVTNTYTYVSDTVFAMFGLDRKNCPVFTSEIFWSMVHPGDVAMVKKNLQTPGDAFCSTLTFRIIRPDGVVVHVKRNREAVYAEGRLVRTVGTIQDISDLVRSEQALRESEERFRFLVQNGNDAIAIIDSSGVYKFVGTNGETHLGYQPRELVGANALQQIHPDDQAMVNSYLQKILDHETLTTEAFRFRTKTGEWRWMETTVSNHLDNPIIGGLVVNTRDVTEKKLKEEALVFTEQRLEALVQNGSDLIVIIDERGGFHYSSRNIQPILGYTSEDMKGRNAFDFIHPDDVKRVREEIEKVMRNEGDAKGVQHRFLHKKGYWVWLESKGTNHMANGAIGGILVNSRNIDDRVKLQQRLDRELINKQKEITSAVIRAQESERSQLGLELHDNVNQILTTVKLYNEMYLTDFVQDKELLVKAAKYTQDCINEIRSISKRLSAPTLGKITLQDSVRELVESINLTRRIEINYMPKELDGCMVSEDLHLAIYRIVQESLNNIIKYSEAQRVCIEIGKTGDTISLKIADNGNGFDTTAKRGGIGITNMRTRAENLNGSFLLKSGPGKGTEIVIQFPFQESLRSEHHEIY